MQNKLLTTIMVLIAGCLMAGCVGMYGVRKCERSSSIADFLYPRKQVRVEPSMPVLQLPLKVGVAFVPSTNRYSGDFTDYQKQQLLEKVADTFRAQKIVDTVQAIPTTYLREGGSFDNLDQLKNMLGIDVVILLSYDQMQFTDNNFLSLSYWTIVGAYVIHGNKNDTHTMVEAVVYDIASRSLLFRAPGSDELHGTSTAIGLNEKRREDSSKSMNSATADLIKNLDTELNNFRASVKEGRAKVKIEHRAGYTGGGAADVWLVALLGLAAGVAWVRRKA